MKGRLFKRRSDTPDVYLDNDVELAWSIWKEAIELGFKHGFKDGYKQAQFDEEESGLI
jgi:hypothetical protein